MTPGCVASLSPHRRQTFDEMLLSAYHQVDICEASGGLRSPMTSPSAETASFRKHYCAQIEVTALHLRRHKVTVS